MTLVLIYTLTNQRQYLEPTQASTTELFHENT